CKMQNPSWTLRYRLRLSSLYHLKRARFYDLWEKWAQAISILASTTALTQLVQGNTLMQVWATVAVAVVSTLQLVFQPANKTHLHADIAKDTRQLLARVEEAGSRATPEQEDHWRGQLMEIESTEPSALSALVAECQYQLALAVPDADRPPRPSWLRRRLMHFVDFSPETP
ncbi:MAG: hypothetical protein RLZZ598_2019, partial [Pseudomonadota bacterium]